MFKDFDRRLQRDLKRIVDARLRITEQLSGGRIKVSVAYTYTYSIYICNFTAEQWPLNFLHTCLFSQFLPVSLSYFLIIL